MSEQEPQETIHRWLLNDGIGIAMLGAPVEVREAIRAVLAKSEAEERVTNDYRVRLDRAEAERDALADELAEECAKVGNRDSALDALRAEVLRLAEALAQAHKSAVIASAEVERLREVAVGNHSTPDECPLWYDGCNCTVGALVHNFDRAERAEAALREIEETTEGIPEANCALANRIALAALGDTAPAPWGVADEERFLARCALPDPALSCPHGHPAGSARDCACHEQDAADRRMRQEVDR